MFKSERRLRLVRMSLDLLFSWKSSPMIVKEEGGKYGIKVVTVDGIPEDARVVGFWEDAERNEIVLKMTSREWKELEDGMHIPELLVAVRSRIVYLTEEQVKALDGFASVAQPVPVEFSFTDANAWVATKGYVDAVMSVEKPKGGEDMSDLNAMLKQLQDSCPSFNLPSDLVGNEKADGYASARATEQQFYGPSPLRACAKAFYAEAAINEVLRKEYTTPKLREIEENKTNRASLGPLLTADGPKNCAARAGQDMGLVVPVDDWQKIVPYAEMQLKEKGAAYIWCVRNAFGHVCELYALENRLVDMQERDWKVRRGEKEWVTIPDADMIVLMRQAVPVVRLSAPMTEEEIVKLRQKFDARFGGLPKEESKVLKDGVWVSVDPSTDPGPWMGVDVGFDEPIVVDAEPRENPFLKYRDGA